MPKLNALLFFLAAVVTFTACRSALPGSASFASVVIPDRTPEEIKQAATRVFQQDGYRAYSLDSGQLVFQKEGTRGQNLAYEGVVGTHYGAQTLVRVRAEIVDLGSGSFRLQCQAFIVTGAGDSFFEEEKRMANFRGGPYQRLLEKVKTSLK